MLNKFNQYFCFRGRQSKAKTTFYLIWEEYAKHSSEGVKLFKFLFVVWGLYAVAALMRPKKKNIGYNLLDIVSKNFYGLYIYYVIKTISLKTL